MAGNMRNHPAARLLADQLTSWAPFEIKRMFGGMGAWRDSAFFALIDGDDVFFKVDAQGRAEYVALGSKPFSFTRMKSGVPHLTVIDKWWKVPDEVMEDADRLVEWAQRAYELARATPDKPTKVRSGTANDDFQSLGRSLLPKLRTIGITSHSQLAKAGAIDSYRRLKARFPADAPISVLWKLYAAANRVPLTDIDNELKAHLKSLLCSK